MERTYLLGSSSVVIVDMMRCQVIVATFMHGRLEAKLTTMDLFDLCEKNTS